MSDGGEGSQARVFQWSREGRWACTTRAGTRTACILENYEWFTIFLSAVGMDVQVLELQQVENLLQIFVHFHGLHGTLNNCQQQ
jgi:hypothetical protein